MRSGSPLHLIIGAALSYGAHACGIYAGAMAFFGVLSLFPLLLLLISLLSILVRQAEAIDLVLSRVAGFLPGSESVVNRALQDVTGAQPVLLGLGTIGLLWSAMGVFLTVGYALNRVWEVPHDRSLVLEHVIAALLAVSVGLLVLLSLLLSTLVVVLRSLEEALSRAGIASVDVLILIGSQALDMVLVGVAAAVLYRVLPNTQVRWRHVLLPACLMAIFLEAAKLGFAWYLAVFAQFDRIYGPIAAVAGLMFWLFVSSTLFLMGAELSHQLALLERETPTETEVATRAL